MTSEQRRTFESGPARRDRTIVTVGFVGYSGAGKTVCMLRFAAGMQAAIGGKTVLIDTNLKRSLYYAPRPGELAVPGQTFDFDHVNFTPPFDAASVRAAFEHAIRLGATRILYDCASDEWEGQGGVLDAHDRAIDEMIDRKRDKGNNEPEWKLRERLSNTAWIKVKRAHLELRLWMWQQPVDWLLSFRAKKKVDVAKQSAGGKSAGGKGGDRDDKDERSWQPIGSDELVYDLMLRCLLPPSSDGRPNWDPVTDKEKLLVKPPPGPIRELLRAHPQVNEELGYQIARWATGHDIEIRSAGASTSPTATSSPRTAGAAKPAATADVDPVSPLVARFDACTTREQFDAVDAEVRRTWRSLSGAQLAAVKRAGAAADQRVKSAPPPARAAEQSDEAREIAEIEAAEAAEQERQRQEQEGDQDGT